MNPSSGRSFVCYTPGRAGRVVRLGLGCVSLLALAACASGGNRAALGPSTGYYVGHAAHEYNPPGPPGDPWGPYIQAAATRFDVPQAWIRQVMRVESGGHEYIGGHLTVSGAGAMGLMQLEPGTYDEMAARYGLGSDPFNPYDNIMAGTAYIHEMYAVYGSPGFLAAYDAGPGRLDSFMNNHEPLPDETINYVAMIAPNIQGYYPAERSDADQLALNTLPEGKGRGILPPGFSPDAPSPPTPAPAMVEVAAAMPAPEPVLYSPPPAPAPAYVPPQVQLPAQTSLYSAPPVAPERVPLPLPPPPSPGFSIIPSAMADTLPPEPAHHFASTERGGWAIQVGAYDTSSNARAALGMAELSAVRMLVAGRPVVVSVHAAGHIKYRARFVGLPHDDAVNACDRLSDGPTGCVVLSPEAQS